MVVGPGSFPNELPRHLNVALSWMTTGWEGVNWNTQMGIRWETELDVRSQVDRVLDLTLIDAVQGFRETKGNAR